MAEHNLLVRALQPTDNSAILEVPEHDVALAVSRREEPPVGREARLARVAGDRVPCKALLALRGGARETGLARTEER